MTLCNPNSKYVESSKPSTIFGEKEGSLFVPFFDSEEEEGIF
jgi:hypothetical protein